MSRYGPSFTASVPRRLRRQGFRGGTVTVVLTQDLVGLVGAEGGDRAIPLSHIAGLRAGLLQGKYRQYPELRLFLRDEAPLRLDPVADPADAAAAGRSYPVFVRSLAARLAAEGRLFAVEVGTDRAWTTLFTILLALPGAAMVVITAWTWLTWLPDVERWIARGFTGLVALLLVWLPVWFWRAHWPRPVRDLADLDRVLPRS